MKWTVVALYEDNHQRYATSVEADTPEDAEALAQAEANEVNDGDTPLLIAGIIAGEHDVAA